MHRDPGYERRARRAGAMNFLAQLRGNPAMQETAVHLALLECSRYPDLAPSMVFRSVQEIVDALAGNPAALAVALEAELTDTTPPDPNAGAGTT